MINVVLDKVAAAMAAAVVTKGVEIFMDDFETEVTVPIENASSVEVRLIAVTVKASRLTVSIDLEKDDGEA